MADNYLPHARRDPVAVDATIAELAATFGNRLVTSQAVCRQHGNTATWIACHRTAGPFQACPSISGLDCLVDLQLSWRIEGLERPWVTPNLNLDALLPDARFWRRRGTRDSADEPLRIA